MTGRLLPLPPGSASGPGAAGWARRLGGVLAALLLLAGLLLAPCALWAGPVDWQEVPATAAGRQWWDAGSVRLGRNGSLTVLSRFQPAAAPEAEAGARAPAASLYVMELDCGQELYRDTSVNGFPRFRPGWQPTAGDDLTAAVLRSACAAGAGLLAAATP